MSQSIFDRLNLRPQERRLVVIVGMVIFVLLNMWFVWPYFDDWGTTKGEIEKNRTTLERYNREIGNKQRYEGRLRELETTGSEMLASELELQRIVQIQAATAGVQLGRQTFVKAPTGRTNQFFQEGGLSIEFSAGGKEIVDFLVGVAAQNAMIRVREMNISPRDNNTRLGGTLVFVGNFQPRTAPTNAPTRSVATTAQPKK
jgi:Tfp pilus assembly protein PilO